MKFTKTHEWIEKAGENYRVGISNYAQEALSDIIYVESEQIDIEIKKGERLGSLESVKSAEDFYAPIDLRIVKFNDKLEDAAELVNSSAENEGCIVEFKILNESQFNELMDEEEYKKYLETI
jgi:glycine cleavage system H protein